MPAAIVSGAASGGDAKCVIRSPAAKYIQAMPLPGGHSIERQGREGEGAHRGVAPSRWRDGGVGGEAGGWRAPAGKNFATFEGVGGCVAGVFP